jgi:hypothetical protein
VPTADQTPPAFAAFVAAMGPARWLGMNFCNTALTVIRYAPERPPSILLFNDQSHLPEILRWTGFPPALRP